MTPASCRCPLTVGGEKSVTTQHILILEELVCKQSDIPELYNIKRTNNCKYWEVTKVIHMQYMRNCTFNSEKSAASVRDGQEMTTLRQGSIDPISRLTADSTAGWVAFHGHAGC